MKEQRVVMAYNVALAIIMSASYFVIRQNGLSVDKIAAISCAAAAVVFSVLMRYSFEVRKQRYTAAKTTAPLSICGQTEVYV